jgi:Uma2 family endonuclease
MSAITQTMQPAGGPDGAYYPPFRMSIDQYERLVDSGVFTKRDKLQLINGILVAKVTKKPPHAVSSDLCRNSFSRILPAGWHLRAENPVRIPPDSEPEPDLCVVRGSERDYSACHPGPAAIGLLVEIADSSVAADRGMASTFSASGIPVYWIVNLVDRQVEVFTSPTSDGYGEMRIFKPGEKVPIVLDGIVVDHIAVSDMLP